MTAITIEGREITLPIYKLGLMIKAAPFVDKVMAVGRALGGAGGDVNAVPALSSMSAMLGLLDDIIEVVAIGASKVDPTLTADALRDVFGLADLPALRAAFSGVLRDAGIATVGIARDHKGVLDVNQPDPDAAAAA